MSLSTSELSTGGLAGTRCRLLCILLLLLLVLGGCSSTAFVYNRLNLVLPWYLERYVDLDREQNRQLDARLEALLSWHRREELPVYAELLGDMERALDGQLSAQQVGLFTGAMEEAWYRTRDRGLRELLALGATLDEEQIGEFIGTLTKRQRKYERKYLERSDDEFREEATEELRDVFEDYLGRLDAAQRAAVERCARDLQRSDSYWLRERAEWIATLEAELAREEGWQGRLERLILEWESQLDPDTRALYEHNTQRVQEVIAEVLNLRSERQDRRLRRKLEDYRDDFLMLASQATPAANTAPGAR